MTLVLLDNDEQFFAQHPDRQARIRNAFGDENGGEFASLGPHDQKRRRIICWRVPKNARVGAGQILKITFLAFADESIRDDDATLLPIINELTMEAAKGYGIKPPWRK
jgi:hypothetical protein